jgi:hypothetical protein
MTLMYLVKAYAAMGVGLAAILAAWRLLVWWLS